MHVSKNTISTAAVVGKGLWRLGLRAAILIFISSFTSGLLFAKENSFSVLSYHDVVLNREDLTDDSVTLDHLVNHFEWLLAHDYHPVSVTDILAARAGKKALPPNAILLSFDDGYVSFYDYVFPLLKAYQFPAVLCLAGSWMEVPEGGQVHYGKSGLPRNSLLSWDQVRELDHSKLVEIASHSYNLHQEVMADAEGNDLAAATTLKYNKNNNLYESPTAYRKRISDDLQQAQKNLKERLGHPARVIVWPFGRYTDTAVEVAVETGFSMALTLNREPGRLNDLLHTGRYYVWRNPTALDFRGMLETPLEKVVGRFPLLEASSFAQDSFHNEKQLGSWLDRCSKMSPDGVCIRPYEFRNGKVTGIFSSEHLPTSRDQLLRLVWQTRTRGKTRPILWLVNDRKEWQWSDKKMIQTWPELGPTAPVFGLVLGGRDLTPALLGLPWQRYHSEEDTLAEQTPSMRRNRRQALLKESDTHSSFANQALMKLEAFQNWQPYVRVYLTLPWKQARAMEDPELRDLLMAFDRLVLDARGLSLRDLERDLRERPLQTTLATHGQLLVDFKHNGRRAVGGDSQRLAKMLQGASRLGLLSWIYDHDWPSENLPNMKRMRPLMSAESFPWNDVEFRLWSEAGEKRKKEKEGH